jgi:HlyD family secretion protein
MKNLVQKAIIVLVIAAIGTAAVMWYLHSNGDKTVAFRTVQVKRGDLMATIKSTGTVEPEEVVDVGAQVAGQINTFGKDANGKTVDYGSVVEEGTILAQIDDSLYASDVAIATAQWEAAKAGVQRAQADLIQLNAKLDQAKADWDRAQKLGPSEALAQTSYDAYKAAFETAQANVAVGEAAIDQAKASVNQAEATLNREKRNLGYCTIKSPVKGVIIDRRVNIGQTVVSSLNAPSLFLIAKDLKRMQVWVPVNEVDVGNIHQGQPVLFTVGTYPGQIFTGEVGKVRLNATMTQNVVTYTVEVLTDNSNGRLLPYLTADVEFELSRRENVLLVSNTALRWFPQLEQVAQEFRSEFDRLAAQAGGSDSPRPSKDPNAPAGATTTRGVLWVGENGLVKPIKVSVGLTDGIMTEIQGDDLKEGLAVVIGEQRQQTAGDGTKNPFAVQMPSRNRQPSGGQQR